MQIVLGIEQSVGPAAPPVVPLLRRLSFTDPHYDLVHVVPPPIPAGWPAEMVIAAEALLWHREQESARFLESAERLAAELGVPPDSVARTVLDGLPADRLTAHADATGAQLLAVNASHHSGLERFLMGSVARSLVIGAHQSLLLARPYTGSVPAFRAVFATDHSPYAQRCTQELLRLCPRGIEELVIVSAYPDARLNALSALAGGPAISPAEAMRTALRDRNVALEKSLMSLAPKVSSLVVPAETNEALRQALDELQPQLLILGARGHGLWERLTLGSISFHQALTAPTSVLVLRV